MRVYASLSSPVHYARLVRLDIHDLSTFEDQQSRLSLARSPPSMYVPKAGYAKALCF